MTDQQHDDDQPDDRQAEILAAYAAEFLEQMPPDLRAECELLVAHDPECGRVRVHRTEGGWCLVWVNRLLGIVFDEALVDRVR